MEGSSRPEVLSLFRCHAPTITALSELFVVHKLWDSKDPDELLRQVGPRIRGIQAVGTSNISASLMDALPSLQIISVFGAGYDGIDLDAAKRRGIVVATTPDAVSDCVADLAMGLILAYARRLPFADAFVRDGKWTVKTPLMLPLGRKVSGSRVGIVGLGSIGTVFARRCVGFEMKISYHNRNRKADVPYQYYASLKDLASNSDFLVVLVPGGKETTHLINEEIIRALGKNGVLVNVARGSVVDEKALIRCLKDGSLGGAALDVFEQEPNVPSELSSLSNVVLSPHIGTATEETRQEMGNQMIQNLLAFFDGKPLPSQLKY